MGFSRRLAASMCANHRPYPASRAPWAMRQSWEKLLFMHWPVAIDLLRPLIPSDLEIDTFAGQAWIAVVPFRMRDIYPLGGFAVPWLSAFAELNVRTYVIRDGKPGVWFFSLDAANRLAVQIARQWFKLPYFHADMTCRPLQQAADNAAVDYYSRRIHPGSARAMFEGRYRPIGPVFAAQPGSLEYFLTARYCLYTADQISEPENEQTVVLRGEIDHAPWPLQLAQADIVCNTMTHGLGIALPEQAPLLHYADQLNVVVWPLRDTKD